MGTYSSSPGRITTCCKGGAPKTALPLTGLWGCYTPISSSFQGREWESIMNCGNRQRKEGGGAAQLLRGKPGMVLIGLKMTASHFYLKGPLYPSCRRKQKPTSFKIILWPSSEVEIWDVKDSHRRATMEHDIITQPLLHYCHHKHLKPLILDKYPAL